ncbi:MAG: HD domain-containing protein [Carnobacterium sp.]|uniref:HD domain-containing protein n=1 Tax=Carnobacterium sp. TaxID=48221 RepID=UPI002FC62905
MVSGHQKQILKQTEEYVYDLLKDDASGHDWWHIDRVRNVAKTIAIQETEEVNFFICEMAALLHDVADGKLNKSEAAGEEKIRNWLKTIELEEQERMAILDIILHLSYKGGTNKKRLSSLEGKIVQDADRLDAMGAVGIARTMAYTGAHGRLIHHPDLLPRENLTLEQYRSGEDTGIMHFYEKLLKLKSTMNTSVGKKMASHRHTYMENYLKEFFQEWEGDR